MRRMHKGSVKIGLCMKGGMIKMKCVICGQEIKGHGHNAEPIAKGKCCDICNTYVVIPTRLDQYK